MQGFLKNKRINKKFLTRIVTKKKGLCCCTEA